MVCNFPIHVFFELKFMLGVEAGEYVTNLLHQNFMFKSKTYIVELNIAKTLGNMHIHTFFISLARPLSNKGLITLYKYTLVGI